MRKLPIIETERTILRELFPTDAEDLKEWFGLEEVYKYWGRPPGKRQKNPELLFSETKPNIVSTDLENYVWAIVSKDQGKVIGVMELYDINEDKTAGVGYRLNPAVWNQGYCTEALKAVIEFACCEIAMERIFAKTDVQNTASTRVLSKCGFHLERTVINGRLGLRRCDFFEWCYS